MLHIGQMVLAIIAVRMIAGFAIIVYFNSVGRPVLRALSATLAVNKSKSLGADIENRHTDTANYYDKLDPIKELGSTYDIPCTEKRAVLLAQKIVKSSKSAKYIIHKQVTLLTALLLYLHLSDNQEASINNIATYLAKSKGELDELFDSIKPTDPAFCAKKYYNSFRILSTGLSNNAKSGLLIVIDSIYITSRNRHGDSTHKRRAPAVA